MGKALERAGRRLGAGEVVEGLQAGQDALAGHVIDVPRDDHCGCPGEDSLHHQIVLRECDEYGYSGRSNAHHHGARCLVGRAGLAPATYVPCLGTALL